MSIPMFISGGADYGVKFLDDKGQPVEIEIKGPPPPPPTPPAQQEPAMVRYAFADRPNDNILTLCESYLTELGALVKESQAKGFATP